MSKARLAIIAVTWVGAALFLALFLFLFRVETVNSTTSINSIDETLAAAPSIQFTKTVGLSPVGCAPTDTINVSGPSTVIYCYAVKNTGDVTFTRNTLIEGGVGPLLNNIYMRLGPGESTFFTLTTFLTQTTVTTASWDAYDIESYIIDDTGPYNFIDISVFSSVITIPVGPNGSTNVTTPPPDFINIQIYDEYNHHLRVSMNGVIRQSSYNGAIGPNNQSLPSNHIDKRAIVPFWDDLDNITGTIYHTMTGSAPNRQWIVQWDNVPHEDVNGTITFQTVMTEGVTPILFQYKDVVFGNPAYDGGASATIGVQKNDTTAVQYSFNTASITNGMAIRFIPTFITATDSHTATVIVTPPPAPNIELTKTAGLASGICAPSSTVVVPIGGGDVYYCYEVRNTGNITLSLHNLDDTGVGNIFSAEPINLGPGQSVDTVSLGWEISQTITQDTVNSATWTAFNAGPTNTVTATATATATMETARIYLPAVFKASSTTAVNILWLAPLVVVPATMIVIRRKNLK